MSNRPICQFFAEGRCRKGANCSFQHVKREASPVSTTSLATFISPSTLDRKEAEIKGDLSEYKFIQTKPLSSSYGLGFPAVNNLISGRDMSYEELRLEYYEKRAENKVDEFDATMDARQKDIEFCLDKLKGQERIAARYMQKSAEQSNVATIKPFIAETIEANLQKFQQQSSSPFGQSGFGSAGTATSGSAFGSSGFGATGGSAFGGPSLGGNAFGVQATNAFGGNSGTLGSSGGFGSSGFGSGAGTTAFGGKLPPPPTGSAFGKSSFGSTPAAAGGFGAFGSSVPAPPGASSAFGTSAFGSTSNSSPFATLGTTSTTTTSPFGALANTAVPDTGPSPFGSLANPAKSDSKPSPFGAPVGSSSIFGGSSLNSSPFGAQITDNKANPFGSAAPANNNTSSPFGSSSANNNASSPFGALTNQSASPFGAAASNPFASTSTSGTSAFGNPTKATTSMSAGFPSLNTSKNSAPRYMQTNVPEEYTKIDELPEDIVNVFQSTSFGLGQVPEIAPPPEIC